MRNDINYLKWMEKAESDWEAMLYLAENRPLFNNSVCLHAQQCAEKYLKAILVKYNIIFMKKHDVLYLINILQENEIAFPEDTKIIASKLTDYITETRYPGDWDDPTDEETTEALQSAKEVREFTLNILNK